MLFILRKLRRSFFLPGKLRTYLAYAIGEILLIVIGILVALQILKFFHGGLDRNPRTPKDIDDPTFKETMLNILGPKIYRTTQSLEHSQILLEKNRELHTLVEQELEAL
jgi:hypothetical protein